jgi:ABC-type sugar transport system ATPase subunit
MPLLTALKPIIGMSDRILVMHGGNIRGEWNDAEINENDIISYAFGREER